MLQPDTIQHYVLTPEKPHPTLRLHVSRQWLRRLAPLLTLGLLLLGWHLITTLKLYPEFLIPTPAQVAAAFTEAAQNGTLWKHTGVTLEEMLVGLALGASIGTVLGYAIARLPILEDLLSPVIVAFQSTPIVAYAPLLIIWFGSGTTSKIVTCAVIVFFPTLLNTIVGIRNVPTEQRDLMRSMSGNFWQTFSKLEVPAALPVLLTGLKTSATLSVIGAVVGEFVSSGEGLGYLVMSARHQYNTPLVYVAVFTMTALALTLYMLVTLLEWRLLHWQRRNP
jgi:NitT/TauT family transport system permease protein